MQNSQLDGSSFYWPASQTGVLLLHGFTATTAEVRPLAEFLHHAGFTVSGPLLPGHGAQPPEANRFTWSDWVQCAGDALARLKQDCQEIMIGGESLGGLISLYLAATTPGVNKVLLFAPALKLRSPFIAPLAHSLAPFLAVIEKPHSAPSPADELWQGYTVYPLKAMVQLFQLQNVVMKKLAEIEQPLLIVQGNLDRSVDPAVPGLIRSRVRSAEVEIHWLKNSGHCVLLEAEQQQAQQIALNFIQKLPL